MVSQSKDCHDSMINAQTVPYRRSDKGVEENSEHARSVLPSSLFVCPDSPVSAQRCQLWEKPVTERPWCISSPLLTSPSQYVPSQRCSQTDCKNIGKCVFFEPEYRLTVEGVKLSGQGAQSTMANQRLVFPIKAFCFWMPVLDVPILTCFLSVSSTKCGSIFLMMVSVWWGRHVIKQPITWVTVQWGACDPSPEHQDIQGRAFLCLLMSRKEQLLSE